MDRYILWEIFRHALFAKNPENIRTFRKLAILSKQWNKILKEEMRKLILTRQIHLNFFNPWNDQEILRLIWQIEAHLFPTINSRPVYDYLKLDSRFTWGIIFDWFLKLAQFMGWRYKLSEPREICEKSPNTSTMVLYRKVRVYFS